MLKKSKFLILLLLVFTVSCSSSSAPPYTAAIQEGQTAAQEMLSQNNASAIAIALVSRDRVIWSETFGFADQEKGVAPTGTPCSPWHRPQRCSPQSP